jgi:hypothetical protein
MLQADKAGWADLLKGVERAVGNREVANALSAEERGAVAKLILAIATIPAEDPDRLARGIGLLTFGDVAAIAKVADKIAGASRWTGGGRHD